jgi:hypothetical protein
LPASIMIKKTEKRVEVRYHIYTAT